ncbi:hypothetical protein [Oceanobacter kriegii]|uniref:hypothetical protein n=1 Tax=Oceanobacter kriegii TaxID=64972 RepID=UPI000425F773|nr:hypothetical protein [Oceanobacter kriegii]
MPTLSGGLLLTTWLLTLIFALGLLDARLEATVFAWLYVLLEFRNLKPKQRKPISALLIGGIGFSALSLWHTGDIDLLALGSEHLMLVMLLTSVNFIRLATRLYAGERNKGAKSFIATLTGMHLFSSVANFSSLLLVGDQIRRPAVAGQAEPTTPSQSSLSYILLSRGFALAIFWSPFLSMIPLVLHQLPDVNMAAVYPWAIGIVVFALLFTLLESRLRYGKELAEYQGYPMKPTTLMLPAVLIGTLLVAHQLFPNTAMLVLVSIIAVTVPLLLMIATQPLQESSKRVGNLVTNVLPNARPEISLFLAAGFLAAAVKSTISAGLIPSPVEHTNALVASLGIHQFAVVAIFGGLLAQATTTPTLMAVAYMVGVSLSMSSSVFSGSNFILQGQYGIRNRDVYRDNMPYSIVVLAFSTLLLFVMEANGVQ